MHCKSCHEDKSPDDFYSTNKTNCKECVKAKTRAYRLADIERWRKYDRDRGMRPDRVETRRQYMQTQQGKDAHARAVKKWRENNPDRVRANAFIDKSVQRGKIESQPCVVCGGKAHAHHPDYSRPDYVIWLCPKHHKEEHKRMKQQDRPAA